MLLIDKFWYTANMELETQGRMNLIVLILWLVYGITLILLFYFSYKKLSKVKNQTISSIAKLQAYRAIAGLLMQLSLLGVIVILAIALISGVDYYIPLSLIAITVLSLFVFLLTIYRKNVIALTTEVKEADSEIGSKVQFLAGFSPKLREVIILFLVLSIGIVLLLFVIDILVKLGIV